MRAVVVRSFANGGAKIEEVIEPESLPGYVNIQVHAAGVGFPTLMVLAGTHQNTPPLPFTPGTEAAGIVMDCAEGVTTCKPGDRVIAAVQSGAFAETVVARADRVFVIPNNLSFTDAIHFPTLYATAYGSMKWRAHLATNEVVLVHGAAGGSGLTAIEISKAMGATVIATASTKEKLTAARVHGADHVINYRQQDFRQEVLDLTDGRGADVIFDPVGGDVFDTSLRCIAPEGRIIPIGFAGGGVPKIPANIVLVKNITVIGLYWGYYMDWARQPAGPGVIDRTRLGFVEMFRWFEEGKLKPLTHATYDLADFEAAIDVVRRREVIGKIALTM